MTPPRKVNLKTIAQEAGVSIMTASRAINGTGYVAQETIARIKKIADKHKYRPNLLIRGVQTGKTMTIGVIFPADLGFYTKVLEGLHDELLSCGYSTQLSLIHQDLGDAAIAQERSQLLRLLDLRVDGIVLRPVNDQASDLYFEEVFERRVPLVAIDRKLENVHCDFVGSNDFEAGRQAAEFLSSKGHRNILLVATGDLVSTGRDRRDGFISVATQSRLKTKITIINEDDFEYHEPDALCALQKNPGITAAFCVKDTLAAGLYATAAKLGKKIPEDISILGFGNLDFSHYITPPLSTFDQQPKLIGKAAAELLMHRIKNPESKKLHQRLIPADLLSRGSVNSRLL